MSIELVKTLSQTLNDSELCDAINVLIAARKERHSGQLQEMKNTLAPKDAVEFYHSGHKKYILGTIKRVKTKKALVIEDGTTMVWDVPMGMLRKVN